MATILDVARLAGVSRTTVSRVLNNQPRVDEETRKKVLSVMTELDYQPSRVARNLRRQETHLIAVLIPGISNPFFGGLVQGMEEVAMKKGYNTILCNTDEIPAREIEYLRMMEKKQIDGIILTATKNSLEQIKSFLPFGPIVLACECPEDDLLPSVSIDNLKSAKQVTEHLILKGHKKIGYINGPEQIIICQNRKKGFVQALEKYGLPVSQELLLSSDFTIEGGYKCANQLLELPEKPTAIFAANDEMAVGAIQAAQEKGLRIPQDLAVAGFDNVQISTVIHPKLTTVEQPIFQIGVKAMELMLAALEGPIKEEKKIVLESSLRIREST